MSHKISDASLHDLLDVLGYPSNAVMWAIEILQGRVDIASLRGDHHPVDRTCYLLPREYIKQVMEAAHAVMERRTAGGTHDTTPFLNEQVSVDKKS